MSADRNGTNSTTNEDGWWEMVFAEQEAIQDDYGCGRGECFTFACECRRRAIENVSRDTGVCFADQE
jgi:hypothetical protein